MFCPLLGRMHHSWGLQKQPFPQFPMGMSQTQTGSGENTTHKSQLGSEVVLVFSWVGPASW